ncbi:MAG: hypothetical protein JWM27_4894 [Gemmatimonadetes bacterium]|nr:hypothetical protein [Gemmatimonadota bacterium]
MNRWLAFAFCVELAREWKTLWPFMRGQIIDDLWEFFSWMDRHPAGINRQFRHMQLYLLFPIVFERVMTGSGRSRYSGPVAKSPRFRNPP